MLIDSNNVTLDSVPLTGAATGQAIPLTSLLRPGLSEPVCVFIRVTEQPAGGSGVTLSIETADKEKGTFTEVASATVAAADLIPGHILGWRWLPPSVKKPWIRVKATPQGSFTAGKIFAAIVREDPIEYEDGMYIDKGQLQC